ncbi:MAG: PAS domain S-box protein [Bacteroidota bacterium]|nr:PAS domain S-box protein [Bacteroidota bacterium]
MKYKNSIQGQNNDVLIVDDSAFDLRLLSGILSAGGYQVRQAISGELALQSVLAKLPAIILLDVRMTGIDGFEVCRCLKAEQATSNIPVIFISALDDEQSKLQGFQFGGVDYITKPFRKEEVLARVKAHVNLRNIQLELEIQNNKLAEEVEERKRFEENLRESEDRYNAFINANVDMMFVKDDHFRYLIANDAMARFFGKTKEEMLHKTDQELAEEKMTFPCQSSDRKALESESSFVVEELLGDRYCETTKFPLQLKDHKKGIGGIIRDVTDQKKAEEAILNERKLLRTLIDNLPDPIYVKDLECRKMLANLADVENIGCLNEADTLGKTDLELFEGETGQRGYAEDLNVIQTGKAMINREEVFLDKNGFQRWLLTSKIPLFDQHGNSSGLVGIGRDITEMKKAEVQIQKLTKSIEQSPSTIVITDIHGNIEYVNPKFSEITGYTAEEAIGKNPRILKSGQMSTEVYQHLWNTITAGDVWRGELLNRKKNGKLYWEWATMTSIKNENGIITNYLAIKEDISQRKQMEVDLILAKEKAQESDRLKSAFLANMSHEIRTPLNSIIGFSELLADVDFDVDQKHKFIQHIVANGNNLLTIISDIMDISRMESGQVIIRKEKVAVNELMDRIRNQFAIKVEDQNLEFRIDLPELDYEIFILADVERMHQIFNNVIGNALKFTSDGGFIQIGYQLRDEMVQFHVKDTGIGISAEFHDKIFERFRQVETSNTRKYGGNGLGLAITKNLVEVMGGKIWLESEPGKGTTLYFVLPVFTNS